LLGYIGFNPGRLLVRRAIRYLRETQEDDGSWYGRWGVNYIYGTWQVLRGLRAIGEDMTQSWILRGRDWLESCQNDDGGWGERCASYENPDLKGQGPSTASQTAWALMGNLRLWRSRSAQHPARIVLPALDPTRRWRLGRT
jgi:squalene-hopene/tetraprenyl-beta-curcumene cyclase